MTNRFLELATLVAQSIGAGDDQRRVAPDLPATPRPTAQELGLRQQYQAAAEAAVAELQRGDDIRRKYQEADLRCRGRLEADSRRLGIVECAGGNAFYFGRRASGHSYTPEEAAAMEARIAPNIAKVNLQSEFTTPLRFSGFPYC